MARVGPIIAPDISCGCVDGAVLALAPDVRALAVPA